MSFDEAIDKGLENITVCSTAISSIQNEKLFLRGWSLEDLSKNSSFSEVSFLLWEGHLPSKKEFQSWEEQLSQAMILTAEEKKVLQTLPVKGVTPMAWLRTALSVLSLFYKEPAPDNREEVKQLAVRFLAKTPLLVSFFHRLREGNPSLDVKKEKSLSWNFLYTLTGKEPSDESVKVFDTCLILHADHGLNCSTFTARVTSSSLSDLSSALVSAIGSLKGPLHGGANEQVMKMLQQFSSLKEALQFVTQALEKKQKIMGFGHRIYKKFDPRAEILKKFSQQLTKEAGFSQLFEISQAIEEKIKKEKNLPANVDFYSASVYHCLGIPTDLFTPVFAMSRVAGWVAHILEQYSKNRIYRPLSRWLNTSDKKWTPFSERH